MQNNRITKFELENIIESRLSMQSTKRDLLYTYKVSEPSLKYLTSILFLNRLETFEPMKRKMFFNLIAGKYYKFADNMFGEYYKNLV